MEKSKVSIGISFDNLVHHHRTTSNTIRAIARSRKGGTPVGYESFGGE